MRALELRAHYSLQPRRAALWVAERECRNPWQLAGNRRSKDGSAPWQHGRPRANECPRDSPSDTQECARHEQGDQAEWNLECQADQEAGFEGCMKRRGFGVDEALDQLLHAERERWQGKEEPR